MADKVRTLAKVIANEINKSRLYNNATTAMGNATDIAHEKISNLQAISASKYDSIVKQINPDVTIYQDLKETPLLLQRPLPKKIQQWWQWYQHLTGLDKVESMKEQVNLAQNKLFKCQDERRTLNKQVTLLNDKLKEIYAELVQTRREDPKYVQLTILENQTLQGQSRVIKQLELLEKEERDHFTLLATAIKEYHDSQTMNAQKYKYISILASALLAIVSLTGSMIYNNKRIADVRTVITQAQEKNEQSFNSKFTEICTLLQNQKPVIIQKHSVVQTENVVAEQGSSFPYFSTVKMVAAGAVGAVTLVLMKIFG